MRLNLRDPGGRFAFDFEFACAAPVVVQRCVLVRAGQDALESHHSTFLNGTTCMGLGLSCRIGCGMKGNTFELHHSSFLDGITCLGIGLSCRFGCDIKGREYRGKHSAFAFL